MVAFVQKRLQVFVSSTYTDLKPERQAAVEAILTAGHIPAGMELFAAGDESQMEVIKQWIDQSDVYMLIIGTRYGSIDPKSDKSYTQLEYEYALSRNKPAFACVIHESARDARFRDLGQLAVDNYGAKLNEFRALALSKVSRFWEDAKDIKIAVSESLANIARQDGLTGWIRGDQRIDAADLAQEIARLSKENANLREEVSKFSEGTQFHGLSYAKLKAKLEKTPALATLDNFRAGFAAQTHGIPVGCEDLLTYGLCEKANSSAAGRLTDLVRRFLNALDEERAQSKGA
jgi:hypothetical protein